MKGMTPGNVGASAGAAPKAAAPAAAAAAVKPPKTELQNGKQWTIVSRWFALILPEMKTEMRIEATRWNGDAAIPLCVLNAGESDSSRA